MKNLENIKDFISFDANNPELEGQVKNWKFRILESAKIIQFGNFTTFDRWANSVDYFCRIPKNNKEFEMIINWLEINGKGNSSWGQGEFISLRAVKRFDYLKNFKTMPSKKDGKFDSKYFNRKGKNNEFR